MKIYPRFIEIIEGVHVYKVTISNQSHDGSVLLYQIKRSEVKVVSYQPKKGYVESGKNQDIEITITDPNFARTRLQVKLVAIQRNQIVEDFGMCWEIGLKRSGLVKKLIDIHNNRFDALNSHADARAPANSPANTDYIQFRLSGGQSGNTSSFQARNPHHGHHGMTHHQQMEINFQNNLRTVSKGSYDDQDDAISALSNNHSPTFPASPRDHSPTGRHRKGYDYTQESNASVIDFSSAQKHHGGGGGGNAYHDHQRHSTSSLDSVASSLYFSPSSPTDDPHGENTLNLRHLMETSPIKRINYESSAAAVAAGHDREEHHMGGGGGAGLNHSLHSQQDHADTLNILSMLSRLNHTGTLDSQFSNAALHRAGVSSSADFHAGGRMNLGQGQAPSDPNALLAAVTNLILSSQQQQHQHQSNSSQLNMSSRNDVTSTSDLEPKIDADQCSRLIPNNRPTTGGSAAGTSYILELYSDYITVDNVTAIIEYRLHQAYSYSYRINAIQFSNNRTISNINQLIGSLFAPTEVPGISAAEMAMENQISSMMRIILEDNLQSITINSCQSLLTVNSLTLNKYTKITSLNLSYNNLKSIDSLLELVHLKYLNLSFNNLKSLDYLQSLVKLKVLDVSHNRISSLMLSINMLVSLSDTLLHLDMTDNPVCNDARYVQEVITVMPRLRYFDTVDLQALSPTSGTTGRSRSAVKCTANRGFIARVRRVLGTKSHQNIVNNRRQGSGMVSDSANNSDREYDEEDEDDLFQYLDNDRQQNNNNRAAAGPVAAALAAERNLLNTSQIKASVAQQQQPVYQQQQPSQQQQQYSAPPVKTSTLQPFPGDNRGANTSTGSAVGSKPFQQTYPPARSNNSSAANSSAANTTNNRSSNSARTPVSLGSGVNRKKLYENLHATHTATSVQKRRSQIANKMVELIPDWNNNRAHVAAAVAAEHTPHFVPSEHQKHTIWEHHGRGDSNTSRSSGGGGGAGGVVNNSVLHNTSGSLGRSHSTTPPRAAEQRASDRRRSLASHNGGGGGGGYHSEGYEGASPRRMMRRGSSSHKPVSVASFEGMDDASFSRGYHSEGEIDRRRSRSYLDVDDEKFEQMQEDERYGIYHPRYRVPQPNLGFSHHIFLHTKIPKMKKKAPLYDETIKRIRDGFEKLPTRGTFTRASKGLTADWYPMDRDTIEAIRRQGFFHQAIGDRLEFSYRDFSTRKSQSSLNESISPRGDAFVTQANGSVLLSPTKKGRRGSVGQHQSRILKHDEVSPSFDPNGSVVSFHSLHSQQPAGQPSTSVNHLHPTQNKEDDFSGYRKWHSGRRVSISPAYSDGYRSSDSPTMFQQQYHDHGSLDEVHHQQQQQQPQGQDHLRPQMQRQNASPSPNRSGIPKPRPNQSPIHVTKNSGNGNDLSPRYEQQPAALLPVEDGRTAVMSPIAKLFNIVDSYGNGGANSNNNNNNNSVNTSEGSIASQLPLLPAERGSGSLYSEYMANRRGGENERTRSPGEEEKKIAKYMNWLDTTHEQLRR